ncbi:hypothetical protein JCM6882_001517, partial [Rhodosporidiobolus microsporus]
PPFPPSFPLNPGLTFPPPPSPPPPPPPTTQVEPGATLPIDATQEQPSISFEAAEGKERFTLALLDPDAPSRGDPKWAPFRHWLVTGLNPGTPTRLEGGEELTPYMGPAPPPGTGPHRYAFLLYRQPAGSTPKFFGDKEDRKQYDIKKFVEENKLTLVGANFFLAEDKSKE